MLKIEIEIEDYQNIRDINIIEGVIEGKIEKEICINGHTYTIVYDMEGNETEMYDPYGYSVFEHQGHLCAEEITNINIAIKEIADIGDFFQICYETDYHKTEQYTMICTDNMYETYEKNVTLEAIGTKITLED